MFKKSPGKIIVNKFYAIFLLEADFNIINKLVFNTRLLLLIEYSNMIPKELVRGCYRYSMIHVTLGKKLATDIAN